MNIYDPDAIESDSGNAVVITSATNTTQVGASSTSAANILKLMAQSGSTWGNIIKFLTGSTQNGSIEVTSDGKVKFGAGSSGWHEFTGKLKAMTHGISASFVDSAQFVHLAECSEPDAAPDYSVLRYSTHGLCYKVGNALYKVQLSASPVEEF